MRGRPVGVVASVLAAALLGCGTGGSGDRSVSSDSSSGRAPATVTSLPQSGSSAGPSTGPASAVSAQPTTSSTVVPTSLVYPDAINDSMIVEDGHYATVEEMAQAADLVMVGDVVGVESLGRPSLEEDPGADEYVAITVDAAEVLKGGDVERVVLGWDAIQVDPNGNRVATLLNNGIRPPEVGDHMLLFLDPAAPSFVEALGGRPTHWPVLLDGVAYLDGDRLVAGETVSITADRLLAMTLPQIRRIVHQAAEHPRDVGEPIQPGGG